MKERGILFSAPMVRAIAAGTKTQTRRVVSRRVLEGIDAMTQRADGTPAETSDLGLFYDRPEFEDSRGRVRPAKHPEWLVYCSEYPDEGSIPIGQGHGAVGDRLWVRETYAKYGDQIEYRASPICGGDPDGGWRPSLFMPRAASRFTLEITAARIERLQDISESDALAEGIVRQTNGTFDGGSAAMGVTPQIAYMRLWESINGQGSWALNPWVWAISFRRLQDVAGALAA